MFLMMKKSPGAPWAGLPAAVRIPPGMEAIGSDRKPWAPWAGLPAAVRRIPRNGSDRKPWGFSSDFLPPLKVTFTPTQGDVYPHSR